MHGSGAGRLSADESRVVITGAGGWLGLATLEMLHSLLGESFHRRVVCFGSTGRTLTLRGGVEIAQRGLIALSDLPPFPSLVLHFAFQTTGAMTDRAEVLTAANRAIGEQVRNALDQIGARAVFVASSGAANLNYSAGRSAFKHLYGSLKLEDESRFGSWARESRKTAVIARLFNLSGPYINNRSHYALACFIADVLAHRPINIRATNRVYRSYAAIEEVMSVVFGALTLPGPSIWSFDAVGGTTYEMEEIAESVAMVLNHQFGLSRPRLSEGESEDRYVGDGSTYHALRRELGVSLIDFPDQVKQTARYMASYPESR